MKQIKRQSAHYQKLEAEMDQFLYKLNNRTNINKELAAYSE